VSKGLATVVRYRQGDDQRSSCYDDLLKAEDRAEKKAVGLHSKKETPIVRVADISGVRHRCKSNRCIIYTIELPGAVMLSGANNGDISSGVQGHMIC